MNLNSYVPVLEFVDKKLNQIYSQDKEKRLMNKSMKVVEEVGELFDEILSSFNAQERKTKLDKYHHHKLTDEWCDVLATVILLGFEIGVNDQDLQKKLLELKNRFDI